MTLANFKLSSIALAVVSATFAVSAMAKPEPVAAEAHEFTLGKLQFFALRDADNVLDNDTKVFGVGHTPAEVAAVLHGAGAAENPIRLSVDGLLVKAPGRVMLFDTGLGPSVHGVLLQSLAKAGVQPADVTDVFITHSHGDHVGGLLTAGGVSAFPRAAIHLSSREWAWMRGQPQSAPTSKAIATQVNAFEPGADVVPGVKSIALYGHTPGHVGYEISSGDAHLLDIGDTAHSSIISLAQPDWVIGYDTDAEQGRQTRKAELAQLAKSGELVFGPHMPFPGLGYIKASGSGYVWQPMAQ